MTRLSKSRFMAGAQCHRRLWWSVHEPQAPELQPDPGLAATFGRGHRVGEAARGRFPGGVLVEREPWEIAARLADTRAAMSSGAPAVFEASFLEDGIFVAVDVLERVPGGWNLVEVKGTLDVKEPHLLDLAVQDHVVRLAGLRVRSAQLMHLNRSCRHPDLSHLFVRKDVTGEVRRLGRTVSRRAAAMREALDGPPPEVAPGPHCNRPYPCPFAARCWPPLPAHHVSTLYRVGERRLAELRRAGCEVLGDLDPRELGRGPAARQVCAVRSGEVQVEGGLARALRDLRPPISFLDFEAVNPAIPLWPGCRPYQAVPVQFSCHRVGRRGITHAGWLAGGTHDPRADLARALAQACRGTGPILAWSAQFERACQGHLAESVPSLAGRLEAIRDRVVDLLPVVRDHVWHPEFRGGFSLKSVLPALVPELAYDDLALRDGQSASDALEAIVSGAVRGAEKRKLRRDLARYCARDTMGLVRVWQWLWGRVGGGPRPP